MKKFFIITLLFSIHIIAARAQSTTATQNLSLSLTDIVTIGFGSGQTGPTCNIVFTNLSDYANGLPSTDQTLKVVSNKQFNVTMNATTTNFTYSGTASPAPVMPITNILYVEVTANSTGGTVPGIFTNHYGSVTTTPQTIISNCSNGYNQSFSIEYFASPGFVYAAGTYTINVVYTATQL